MINNNGISNILANKQKNIAYSWRNTSINSWITFKLWTKVFFSNYLLTVYTTHMYSHSFHYLNQSEINFRIKICSPSPIWICFENMSQPSVWFTDAFLEQNTLEQNELYSNHSCHSSLLQLLKFLSWFL
jgi:hypothetical protein